MRMIAITFANEADILTIMQTKECLILYAPSNIKVADFPG